MFSYKLSPFATFVESNLFATASQHAVYHRLTGELVEPQPAIYALLQAAQRGLPVSLPPEQLAQWGEGGRQILALVHKELLIGPDHDPLSSFLDYFVIRPLQNPAVTYQIKTGEVQLVSMSMNERVYSPRRGEHPKIIEEQLPVTATSVLGAADGGKTLREIYKSFRRGNQSLLDDAEFRDTIDFLTRPERQLIKLAPGPEVLTQPFHPANLVPRNLYHASKWAGYDDPEAIADFHVQGIEDAAWEFDVIEPTVNHALRFPTEILDGLDYGSRFCDAALDSNILAHRDHFEVLEVGGGTGSFARSFITRSQTRGSSISYRIVDLSPALAESQRQQLSDIGPEVAQISQDATRLDLPGQEFDLIIANEVVADFPVALVTRPTGADEELGGEGAVFVKRYGLPLAAAPERFYVNAGVFRFFERAWRHLRPGGALIITEYGSENHYPAESFHLNHSEFTIHFGHAAQCARRIGFDCEVQTLSSFLRINQSVPVIAGREEHLLCLNHAFRTAGVTLPFALFSAGDFNTKFGELAADLSLAPVRFLPMSSGFHYGPNIRDFLVLILKKSSP